MLKKLLLPLLGIILLASLILFSPKKKYEHNLAVCTIFRNEAPYLKEWIDYHHKALGASHFYLYNNDSTDNYQEVLKPYIDKGLVELIDWESNEQHALRGWSPDYQDEGPLWNAYTIEAYNDCLHQRALKKAKWVACLDVNEYIVPTNEVETFQSLLKKFSIKLPFHSIGTLKMHWRVFASPPPSKYIAEKSLVKQCSQRAKDNHGWHRKKTRSIHRPEAVDVCLLYDAKLKKPFKSKDISCKKVNIHHYLLGLEKRIQKGCIREKFFERVPEIHQQFTCVEDRTIDQYLPLLED